jgi:hypothetical protein
MVERLLMQLLRLCEVSLVTHRLHMRMHTCFNPLHVHTYTRLSLRQQSNFDRDCMHEYVSGRLCKYTSRPCKYTGPV